MGFGPSRHAFADANCNVYTNSYCYSHGYFYGHGNFHCDIHSNCYGYCDSYQHGFAYGYSLRYAAMHTWVVGGTSFSQRPGSLGGCLFLCGLGPKVLRHGRALGRYSRKRLHASV
jgi:hypothetical protein